MLRNATSPSRILTLALLSTPVAGCSVTPTIDPSGPVPLVRGPISAFTPLVGVPGTTPQCRQPAGAPLDAGATAVALVYPPPSARQVTVTLDERGAPTRYVDVRGDLSELDGATSDRTTIALYLDREYAVLSNRAGAERPSVLEVPLEEALSATTLGNPDEMIREVLNSCAHGL